MECKQVRKQKYIEWIICETMLWLVQMKLLLWLHKRINTKMFKKRQHRNSYFNKAKSNFCFFFLIYLFQLEANYFTILWWFLPYIDMNQPWVYMCSPSWTPVPISSLRVIPVHRLQAPVSCIKPGLAIYITYDNIYVSMLFSQIIPPSPSPTGSKRLLFTFVSLLLPRI